MDLTRDALEFLSEQRPIERLLDGNRIYTDREMHELKEPVPASIAVCTLDGFVGLVDQAIEGLDLAAALVHVAAYNDVRLIGKKSNAWGTRQLFSVAKPIDIPGFPFGQFIDHERFVIYLQANFVSSPDLVALVKLASNVTAERIQTSEDDGISQKIGQRRGIVLKGSDTIPGKVKLSPHRTFPEVIQPTSEFAFRARQKDENSLPELALFEADGGAWKLDAMKEVAAYLQNKLAGKVPVIA